MMRLKRYSSKIIKIPKVCSKLCGRLDKFGFNRNVYLLELTFKKHPSLSARSIWI